MNTETPLYDELEAKWSETDNYRTICDRWWTVTHIATGQQWLEDDEGNEVFPEELEFQGEAHLVVREPNQTVIYNAEGHGSEAHVGTCGLVDCGTKRHKAKRKLKLFGRNQGTNGTL